jgi:tetratricopeptide (TPR) repeat protein
MALYYLLRFEQARQVFSRLATDEPNSIAIRIWRLVASASLSSKSEIISVLKDPSIKAFAKRDWAGSFFLSEAYAQLGETENALEWLEHAVDIGFINYPFLNEYDPLLANIRGEERFQKLMERVKYEWEHFEI